VTLIFVSRQRRRRRKIAQTAWPRHNDTKCVYEECGLSMLSGGWEKIRFWKRRRDSAALAFGEWVPGEKGFKLEGWVDLRTSASVRGWVWNRDNPADRLRVIARTQSHILASGVADIYRPDLETAGIGDGRHAFILRFPACDVNHILTETVETRRIIPVGPWATADAMIHRGEDGWLFLRTGENHVERFFTEASYFSYAEIARWCALLDERKQRLKNQGIAYFHMIAPDKITVYSNKFGRSLPHFNSRPSSVLPNALGSIGLRDIYIDVAPDLIKERDNDLLYLKTDTHWTFAGALVAARSICRAMQLKCPDFGHRPLLTYSSALDLGEKLDPPADESVAVFEFLAPAELTYANCLVNLSSSFGQYRSGLLRGSHVIYRNERAPNDLTLVLFGDSFCELPQVLLTGMLAQVFREVHFMWSNSIDFGYVAEIRPDIVLTEIAERFVKTFPDDERDLRSFALARHAEFLANVPSA
jgi:alginate O-acetyltransferase complex protein AlgJ